MELPPQFHETVVATLCRLCGGKANENKSLVSKHTLAKDIKNSIAVDLSQDKSEVHPWGVCNACRMKISRWKVKKSQKVKDLMPPQIVVMDFKPHEDNCIICDREKFNKDLLLELCRKQGLSAWIAKDGSVVACVIHDLGRTVLKSIVIGDGWWKFYALGREVELKVNTPYEAIDTLIKSNVCVGNTEFSNLESQHKQEGMRGNAGQPVANFEPDFSLAEPDGHWTIRHIKCHLLVLSDSPQCEVCKFYKPNLYAISKASKKEPVAPEFKKNPLLSRDELILKVSQLHKEKRSLVRKNINLEKKIEKMMVLESVTIGDESSAAMHKIVKANEKKLEELLYENEYCNLLWQQQKKALASPTSKQMRWHPDILRWAIAVHSKSASAYDILRSSGFLILPHPNTLYKYTHFVNPVTGINAAFLGRFLTEWKVNEMTQHEREVNLIFDEMKVMSGIVFSRSTGKMVGFLDIGSVNTEMEKFEMRCTGKGEEDAKLASHVLLFMVRGLTSAMKFPMAYFATSNVTASQLTETTLKCIKTLKLMGLKVLCLTSDGASSNRKLYSILSGQASGDKPSYKTENLYERGKDLYFICDPPHLLKTIRNNFENSNWNSKTRKLVFKGKPIQWTHLLQLQEWDHGMVRATPGLQLVPKLKFEHLHLTPGLRMKVSLAAQVMSKSVANALAMMKRPEYSSTIEFILKVDKFFDYLNVSSPIAWQRTRNEALKPYSSVDDERLKWLQETFLGFLDEWRMEAEKVEGLSKKEKEKLCLSKTTLDGCHITVNSFVELVKYLLQLDGVKYFLSDKLNQDIIEEFFGRQRGAGGHHSNPSVDQFGHHLMKNVVAGSKSVGSVRGNVRSRSEASSTKINEEPLPKRKR